MKKYAAFSVFLTLVASACLDIELSLATGLSLKNLLLYVLVMWILFEAVIDSSDGGLLKRQFEYVPLHTANILLIIVAIFSAATCVFVIKYENYGIGHAIIYLKTSLIDRYLMLFVFLAAIRDAKEAIWMIKALLIIMTVAMVLSLIDMFNVLELRIMDPRADGRLQGRRLNSNDYGALMAFFLPLTFALAYQAKGKWKAFWSFSAFIFFFVLVFSTSRGAMLGLILGAIIGLALFSRYINAQSVAKFAVVMTIVAVLTVVLLSIEYGDLLYDRFVEQTMTTDTWRQTSGRTEIWGDALTLMSSAPITFLFGFGWATFEVLNELGSHNTYFEFLFELGLIGLSLITFILFYVMYQILSAVRHISADIRSVLIGFGFGYLSVLVNSLVTHMSTVWLFIWGLVGVMLRLAYLGQHNSEPQPARDFGSQSRTMSMRDVNEPAVGPKI